MLAVVSSIDLRVERTNNSDVVPHGGAASSGRPALVRPRGHARKTSEILQLQEILTSQVVPRAHLLFSTWRHVLLLAEARVLEPAMAHI